jgi:carotenoid 1,2-hydratase
MPTLPLYVPPDAHAAAGASPDASHRVTAPGGYESWHFDAEDVAGDLRVVAALYDGCPFNGDYVRAHARYLRRPTRVAPAVPSQCPVASLTVYERGHVLARFTTQYPPGSLVASDQRPEVRVGPSALRPGEGDGLGLTLADDEITAELSFEPSCKLASPESRRFPSRELTGADHFQVIAHPLYDVTGTLRVRGRTIQFRGRGYHDHQYGSGPIGAGLRRWVRGRVLQGDERVTAFHIAEPVDRSRPAETHVAELHPDSVRCLAGAPARITWSRPTMHRLPFPLEADIGGTCLLSNPRVLEAGPWSARLTYDAIPAAGPRGGGDSSVRGRGTALCDVVYPRRLYRSALRRSVERPLWRGGR